MNLSQSEISLIIETEKLVEQPIRYKLKSNGSHMQAKGIVRCPKFPNLDLSLVSIHHRTIVPRRFSIMLQLGGYRLLSLDVNPHGIHTNPITLEKVRVTHWHIWPNDRAEPDDQNKNHQAWMHDFCKRCNLNFTKGYTAPIFEEEDKQLTFLLGSDT